MARPENPLPGVPHVESPLFQRWLRTAGLSDYETDIAYQLHDKGFAVLDFPDDDFDAVATQIISDLSDLPQFESVKGIPEGKPAQPGHRVQDYIENEGVRRIAANQPMADLLTKLFGRRAFPFQTLNFSLGTQQHFHSDSIHFSSVPERFVVGVWVALEDIGPEQGPLVYYPGTHKWPILQSDDVGHSLARPGDKRGQEIFEDAWRALVEESGIEPEYFYPRKGQALIWCANLLHGGIKHENCLKTRWSQVTHYYFEDCTYTTPIFSNPRLGRVFVRNNVANLMTGQPVPNTYMGEPVELEMTRSVNDREALDRLAGFSFKDFARAKLRKRRQARKAAKQATHEKA